MMIARVLTLGVALVSGTATSQLPEFAQQYRQRIGGAIDALEEVKADFAADSAAASKSVTTALEHMAISTDRFVQMRGQSVERSLDRLYALKEQQLAMSSAAAFERVWVFLKKPDTKLSRATWSDFEPAVPVTLEGGVLAAFGFALGLLFLRLTGAAGRVRRRRRFRQKADI
ncbi:hypothetical protein PsAD2_01216 [Pseudovibrio axinellae]|uniref:DUF2937 domain-containing protein n=1 Tax=Pseudovibrio axinellae TaxID=989403 RepID=A0A166A8P6_9HYPH|nr:DUF2937 family protein [Pseudovibrio axinellae]KZL20728.1 hypothetical protein PsAD2_01216 [Pseudovibrio axinellae]SER24490.1 Protein of unknown function [Pseudovibrio axinellae]